MYKIFITIIINFVRAFTNWKVTVRPLLTVNKTVTFASKNPTPLGVGVCQDEFKEYANSLPKINEDIEYLDNHPNKDVALAMEIIIQIGNAWEDGIRELSPSMKKYLVASLSVLNSTNRNNQINALIKNGNYYLSHMEVLECHNYINYIIMPAL